MINTMKPKKQRLMKAAALRTLVTSLNLDTYSEHFDNLKVALSQVPFREAPPCSDLGEAQEQSELDDDLAGGLHTPISSSMTEQERSSLPREGNAFIVCAGCTSMALFSTGDTSTPFHGKHDTHLTNAIVFTFCKACERSDNALKKIGTYSKLSVALFNQSAAVTIPALIIKEAVPIVCDGRYVKFVCFDEIMRSVGPNVKAFGIETEIEFKDSPSSFLLPHLPGRFL
jgi:hypothetical protein